MATLLTKLCRAVSGSEKVQHSHFWLFHNSGLILSPLRDQRQLNWLCDNTQATDLDHLLNHLVAILRILLWRLSQSDRGNSIQGGDDCQWEEMGGGAKYEQRKTWIGVSPPSWDRGLGKTGPIR